MTLSEAIEIVDPDSGAQANGAEPQDAIDCFLKACRIVCAAAHHKENHIADAGKNVAPENPRRKSDIESTKNGSAPASVGGGNKPPTCEGCAYKVDFPSSVHCFGCSRMYSDHYARRPEDATSEGSKTP